MMAYNKVWNVSNILCSQPQALDVRTSLWLGPQRIHRQPWGNLGNVLIDCMLPFDNRGAADNILQAQFKGVDFPQIFV